MAEGSNAAVVIDNGSGYIKTGFAGEDHPRVVFPTLVGNPENQVAAAACASRRCSYVGNEAQSRRSLLALKRPIHRGVITNWDAMERVWEHVFAELEVQPQDRPVLMILAPMGPEGCREKMAEILLEKFRAPSFFVHVPQVLSLFCSGRTTGMVVDSGYGVSYVVPVVDGLPVKSATQRLDLGGKDLTQHLFTLLRDRGHASLTSLQLDTVRDVKERLCYVAEDIQAEMAKTTELEERTFWLPGAKKATVGNASFRCPEPLFQPGLLGSTGRGLHEMARDAIQGSGEDARPLLLSNIVLAGGTAQFPGLDARLSKELTTFFPMYPKVDVDSPFDMPVSAWCGGAILSSLPTFESMWISRREFEELGPALVCKKCM